MKKIKTWAQLKKKINILKELTVEIYYQCEK